MPKLRLRHAFVAVMITLSMLAQGTWALAGTTGGVTGYVRDTDGHAVADAKVTVTSPSEITSTTTDNTGHFAFLSLPPDTYVLSATKDKYQPNSMAGVTVFADQVQTLAVTLQPELRTIATVHSQAASSLVKSGVGGDIYNVSPSQMKASAALGGGGNLDSAYSAIASVPGLVVGTGGAGWNQAVVVRGNNPWSTGFEYDGIPVNRAFDNYTASTSSNLGLQELQVYTGGGPASISSSGTSGFINQVIKTGTYPGYGNLQGSLAAVGAFYHSARVEAGGATPNRNFSYYVGVSGYDQSFRQIDNNNGASFLNPGSQYASYGYTTELVAVQPGVFNACGPEGLAGLLDGTTPGQGCLPQMTGTWADNNLLQDRENVANFHFAFPRANGQRDDLQLMYSSSAMQTYNLTAPNAENNLNNWQIAMRGLPYCGPNGSEAVAGSCQADSNFFYCGTGSYTCDGAGTFPAAILGVSPGNTYPIYQDAYAYDLPFGTNVAPNGTALMPGIYYQANTPAHSYKEQLPLTGLNDLFNNDTGIVKAQWTHPFDSRSFARLMGYTFFSDWTENGAISGYGAATGWEWDSPNYDLITHTAGTMFQYFNQITDKHLLQFTFNYTHAGVTRFNHSGGGSTSNGSSPVGLISDNGGVYTCYDPTSTTGATVPCYSGAYQTSAGTIHGNGGLPAVPAAAAAQGAYWATLYNGNANGTFNSVKPNFYSFSLEDQFRASDKLTLNASVRLDRFGYNLAAPGPQDPFYAQIVANYSCVNPTDNEVEVNPLGPGDYPPASPVLTAGACPEAGYVHPNGQNGAPLFSLNYPKTYNLTYWQPRISGTYTQNPDTVWRFSAGRFAEPPISASVEYLYRGGSGASLWTNFMALGAYSPFHKIPGETSAQYDLSLEKRIHNTPMSFKITPFWNDTSNWEQQSFIGAGFVTQIPVGRSRSYGVETQFNYGDFNAQGLSGMLSFTYTKSQVQFQKLMGANQIDDMNLAIKNFNALTKAGGGAACYTADSGSGGSPDPSCAAGDIANPYYNMPQQGLLDPNGWYDQGQYALKPGVYTGAPGFYNSPFVTNIVLNYRHDKFAITPSLQLEAGAAYGTPYDVIGVDPRNCGADQGPVATGGTGVVAAGAPTALNCDYTTAGPGAAPAFTYLYVPNPQTGKFANLGQFSEPNIAVANLQMSYDVSPKVTLQLTAADLYHTCFGGSSEPWTKFAAPGRNNCGYYANGFYNEAGWYNGASPFDTAANNGVASYAWEAQSYLPKFNNSIGSFIPFTLYVQAQIKL